MTRKRSALLGAVILALMEAVVNSSTPRLVLAAGVVGTGMPASCTEAALDGALASGGLVTFNCGGSPLTLTVTAPKSIAADTRIDGRGLITLSGGGTTQIFSVSSGVSFAVENLNISDGYGQGGFLGGAISNAGGTLTVTNSTFSGNSGQAALYNSSPGFAIVTNSTFTGNSGGAIANLDAMRVTNSTFTGNSGSAPFRGSAITNWTDGTLTVTNSTFTGNNSAGVGGVISNSGKKLAVTNSTFTGNSGDGFTIAGATCRPTECTVSVTNSTFTGNSGGIADNGTLTVTNSTFFGNSASAITAWGPGLVTLTNTIVADSPSGGNCSGGSGYLTDGGHNLDDDGSCGFSNANDSLSNTNPLLDPARLNDNGGPTQTIALLAGSPAINAGDESVCAAAPVNNVDQRNFARPGIGATNCSIGAYEFNSTGTTGTIRAPLISVKILGPGRIRPHGSTPFYAVVSNQGNVDVPLVVSRISNEAGTSPASTQSPDTSLGCPGQLNSLMSLGAGSINTIPFEVSPSTTGCFTCTLEVYIYSSTDPCPSLLAQLAVAEAAERAAYVAGLTATLALLNSMLLPTPGSGICFSPNSPTSGFCEGLEGAVAGIHAAQEQQSNFKNLICAQAAAAGCIDPAACVLPTPISLLESLADAVQAETEDLKSLLALTPIPPDELSAAYSREAVFLAQALSLPSDIAFPPLPTPVAVPTPDATDSVQSCAIASLDPNGKTGASGAGESAYVSGASPLPYNIFFENSPSATASAQRVIITDQLDPGLDWSTVSFSAIQVGPTTIGAPDPKGPRITTLDLRPGLPLIVNVDAQLDETSGVLTITLDSLDPSTGEPPADPLLGFLPPDVVPPQGQGAIFFTIMPKGGLATNTQIQNQAAIVFDNNSPIATSVWLNTIDNAAPVSQVLALPAIESSASFPVQWSGTDAGAGIQDYRVYVSDNGGPFTIWRENTNETSDTYPGAAGHIYGFFSQARDHVGNFEELKALAEATTTVMLSPAQCVGDCNGDSSVTVDEILAMVNIALGTADVSACTVGDANGDHEITVDEILTAVNNALNGC